MLYKPTPDNYKKSFGYKILKDKIKHQREIMEERQIALKLQAKVDEVKHDLMADDVKDLKQQSKTYITRKEMWLAISTAITIAIFLFNYFKNKGGGYYRLNEY